MTRPDLAVIPPFYKSYVENVKDQDVLEALKSSSKITLEFVRSMPEAKGDFRYAERKWSIKELLNHMMDAERVMAYRALRFARNDKTPLEAFEENDYAPQANAHARSVKQLADELERLRQTTVDLFASFTPEMLNREGIANNNKFSVLSLGYIIAGHETHHRKILKERYFNQ